jgi:Secretion system C-terminal sorting domain
MFLKLISQNLKFQKMKLKLLLCFCLCFPFIIGHTQSYFVKSTCYNNNNTAVFTKLPGNDGGSPARNRFAYTDPTNNVPYTLEWRNSRWEIHYGTADRVHYNASTSNPNPPSTTSGWTLDPAFSGFCSNLTLATLPVELFQFGVQNTEGSKNNLVWRTESEKDNKTFDIERSTDGKTFHSIGQVKGNNKPSSYQFVDNQPFATSYYRLRQIDFDGTETLSKVVSVELKGKGKGLTVYPTLVSNGILTVDTEGGQLRDFSVMNLLGQQVLVGKTTTQIDVSALAKGTYMLKVGSEVAKFVKQ